MRVKSHILVTLNIIKKKQFCSKIKSKNLCSILYKDINLNKKK